MISAEELREILTYDPETGIFRWRHKPSKNIRAGARAGTVSGRSTFSPRGRRYIRIANKPRLEHRLAWLYVYGEWPDFEIDHINGDAHDNRICNLRRATHQQNMANSKVRAHNASGLKGVQRHTLSRKWRARIQVSGRTIHIGLFDTKEEAHEAYMRAARFHFGEFATDGKRG